MCGCDKRKSWLNERWPGSGDAVAVVAEPVKRHGLAVAALAVAALAWGRL